MTARAEVPTPQAPMIDDVEVRLHRAHWDRLRVVSVRMTSLLTPLRRVAASTPPLRALIADIQTLDHELGLFDGGLSSRPPSKAVKRQVLEDIAEAFGLEIAIL